MDCHEVLGAGLISEVAAPFLFHLQYSISSFPNALSKLLDNLAENEIRPMTLGRKNYMFCSNHETVENMCVIQSLLATCRNHDINPRPYPNSVIASMLYFDRAAESDLIQLLPHHWEQYHPEAVMTTMVRQLAK